MFDCDSVINTIKTFLFSFQSGSDIPIEIFTIYRIIKLYILTQSFSFIQISDDNQYAKKSFRNNL